MFEILHNTHIFALSLSESATNFDMGQLDRRLRTRNFTIITTFMVLFFALRIELLLRIASQALAIWLSQANFVLEYNSRLCYNY